MRWSFNAWITISDISTSTFRLFGWRLQRKLCKHLRRQIWPLCQAGGQGKGWGYRSPWSSIIMNDLWKSEVTIRNKHLSYKFAKIIIQIVSWGCAWFLRLWEFPLNLKLHWIRNFSKCWKHTPAIGEDRPMHLPHSKQCYNRGAWTPKPSEASRRVNYSARREDCAQIKETHENTGCWKIYPTTSCLSCKRGMVSGDFFHAS